MVFRKERSYISLTTNSPYSYINGVNTLQIEKSEDPFDVTATARSLFFPSTGRIAYGGQVKVRYKNAAITDSNLWMPAKSKWIPVFSAECRVLKL